MESPPPSQAALVDLQQIRERVDQLKAAGTSDLQINFLEKLIASVERYSRPPSRTQDPSNPSKAGVASQDVRRRAQQVALNRLKNNKPVSEKLRALAAPLPVSSSALVSGNSRAALLVQYRLPVVLLLKPELNLYERFWYWKQHIVNVLLL